MSGSQDPGAQTSTSSGRSNEGPYKAALGWIPSAVAAAAVPILLILLSTQFFMNDILPSIEGVLEWPQLAAWSVTFVTLISAMCYLWCVLVDLPDNKIPSEGATEVARHLEFSPTKGVAQSKPHPDANEEVNEHQGDGSRSTSFLINIFKFVSIGIVVTLLLYAVYERYNTTQLEREESLRKLEVKLSENLLKIEFEIKELKIKENKEIRKYEKEASEAKEKQEELKIKENKEIRKHEKEAREAKEKQEELKIKENKEIRKHEKEAREAKEKQENMEKEEKRFGEQQAIAKTDWTDMIVKETPEIPEGLNMLTDVKEFHSCKAWEDIDKDKYNEIIENMAKTMHLSDDRKEELILSAYATANVNAVEEFDQHTKHSYAKYQTLKRPSGNMDLTIALHVATFNVKLADSNSDSNSNSIAISDRPNSKEIKTFFKVTALETFKEECPPHLFLDKTIQEQKQDKRKVKEKENEEKKRVKEMEEEANNQKMENLHRVEMKKIEDKFEIDKEDRRRKQKVEDDLHSMKMERLAVEKEKIKLKTEAAKEKLAVEKEKIKLETEVAKEKLAVEKEKIKLETEAAEEKLKKGGGLLGWFGV